MSKSSTSVPIVLANDYLYSTLVGGATRVPQRVTDTCRRTEIDAFLTLRFYRRC